MKILTGTFGTSIYRAVMPESIMFIYSKHIYTYLRLVDAEGNGIAGLKIQSVIQGGGGMNAGEYRYTDADGLVRFDIARLLQMMTDNREDEMTDVSYRTDACTSWKTGVYSLRFYISGAVVLESRSQYVNGSHFNAVDWWGNERRLKWWSGYPFTFDFVNTNKVSVSIDNAIKKVVSIPSNASTMLLFNRVNPLSLVSRAEHVVEIMSEMSADYARAFTSPFSTYENKDGDVVVDGMTDMSVDVNVRLEVDNCPARKDCTYLRWLGRHGELFYWLFNNLEETTQTKSDVYVTGSEGLFYGNDTNKIIRNGAVKDVVKTKTKTIYTEPLKACYYDYVVQMAESPYVDMYMGDNRWQRVIVQDGSVARTLKGSGKAKQHQISFTIEIGD